MWAVLDRMQRMGKLGVGEGLKNSHSYLMNEIAVIPTCWLGKKGTKMKKRKILLDFVSKFSAICMKVGLN